MKAKILLGIFVTLVFLTLIFSGEAQTAFQNLGFESANLTNQIAFPSTSDAVPGWSIFIGTNQSYGIAQNIWTLGTASITIFGPAPASGPGLSATAIIDGRFTLFLQPGVDPRTQNSIINTSISQTGLVPANALSLRFKANSYESNLVVTLGGKDLPYLPLSSGSNYTLFAAMIPPEDAGVTEPLVFTAVGLPYGIEGPASDTLDSITFSPDPVPEPNPGALFLIGAFLLGMVRDVNGRSRRQTPPPANSGSRRI